MRGLEKKKLKLFKCYQKNYEFRGGFMGLIDKIIEFFQVLLLGKSIDIAVTSTQDKVVDTVNDAVDEVYSKVGTKVDVITDKVDTITDTVDDKTNDVSNKVEDIVEKSKKLGINIRKK